MGVRAEFVARERAAICDDLAERGPDRPTLCEGWRTRDLLQHLVLREYPGLLTVIGGAAARRRAADRVEACAWPDLIREFRAGPPQGSLFRLPGVDAAADVEEFFVHHEDLRRAVPAWTKRELPPAVQEMFWRRLCSPFGRIMARRVDAGVHVRRPDGRHATLRARRPGAVITGQPSEILLYLFGRRSVADVAIDGSQEARDRLAAARLGF